MLPGPLLASGRDADVYALDERWVVRRYRDGSDTAAEADLMVFLGERGFPVPRVFAVDGPDLTMERLDGPTMAEAITAGEIDMAAAGRMLAGLHDRLHAIGPRQARTAGHTVVHLDLHPLNVMLCAGEPVVIDWRNATDGPPEFDVAVTALILAQVCVGDLPEFTADLRDLLASLLRHCGTDPSAALDRAADYRRGQPDISAVELAGLDRATALARDLCRANTAAAPVTGIGHLP